MILKHIIFLFVVFYTLSSQAQFQDLPGTIPLQDERGVATDLEDKNGRPLIPEDASLYRDLSLLNPGPSDIWNKAPLRSVPELPVKSTGEKLLWTGNIDADLTWLTFSAQQQDSNGSQEFFQILMSRKAHSVLVRARLLQKIGYRIPPLKYLKSFKLDFPTKGRRDDFISRSMRQQLSATPDRWATNLKRVVKGPDSDDPGAVEWKVTAKTEDCNCIYLQDAIAFNSTSHMYNFPIGIVPEGAAQGRRAFEALLVPYGLTYVEESFNLFSWEFGKIQNDRLFIPYEFSNRYFPNFHDGRWISRKILKLSRQDWVEIAQFGSYPKAVELLATEKFISRRNDLIELFDLHEEFQPLPIKTNISYSQNGKTELREGKLLKKQWPGFAPYFAFGDAESPLSNSEVFGFFKSKVYSNIISNVIAEFNDRFMPHTNLPAKVLEKNYELLLDSLVEGAINNTDATIPFGYYTIPYGNTRIIASREIVTGQILGTENPIQMSHTFGMSVEAGQYIGWHGLGQGESANARAQAYFTRTYSHLKPVTSIKAAMKQPYRNIAVQILAKEIGQTLDRFAKGEFDDFDMKDGDDKEDMKADILSVVETFNNHFKVGESLIVSDYLGAFGQGNFGYSLGDVNVSDATLKVRAFIQAKAEAKLISRIHLYRASENVIQIYDDRGQVLQFQIGLGVDIAGVQFLRAEYFKNTFGYATSKYTNLNINSSDGNSGGFANTNLVSHLKVLHSLFTDLNKELLYSTREPISITHSSFDESGFRYKFFWNQGKYLRSNDNLHIEYDGETKHFIRSVRGFRSGKNWQGFGVDTSNVVVNELLTEGNVQLAVQEGSDPGLSFKGRSRARRVIHEAEMDRRVIDGKIVDRMVDNFVQIEHRWRGWKASKEQLKTIIDEINSIYHMGPDGGIRLIRELAMKDVQSLQLYSAHLTLNVYPRAINSLFSVDAKDMRAAFDRAAAYLPANFSGFSSSSPVENTKNPHITQARKDWARKKYKEYYSKMQKYARAYRDKDYRGMSEGIRDVLEHADRNLLWVDFFLFLGGKEDIYVQSRISGFREGDEIDPNNPNGLQSPFIGNTFGMIGSRKANGPVSFVRSQLGITEAEAYIYWIMENL